VREPYVWLTCITRHFGGVEDDIVHLIVDAVSLMDLSGFEATCKVGHAGQPPFAPAMMLALLIYAYSHGVRSSRVIERLCRRDAGYRFIVGDEAPDHTVIARFRQRHAGRMKSVFLQVLELCREAGLIRLGLVALDGTKVKANAALDANRAASSIEEQIGRMLAEAEATDAREDRPPIAAPATRWRCAAAAGDKALNELQFRSPLGAANGHSLPSPMVIVCLAMPRSRYSSV
jgi:transposase